VASAVLAGPPVASRAENRALLPQWLARLAGLAALGWVGAAEWQRLIGSFGTGSALRWVAVAVAVAALVLLAGRRVWALAAIVVLAVFAGYALSGAQLDLLKPRHWDELVTGLGSGIQALGTVKLPYVSADPWPRIALELLGGELLILAGLLTFWPRSAPAAGSRVGWQTPDRGYPFVALAVLIVVVVSPIISLGGTRPALLGLTLAFLSVCFVWLERLPLRPGTGVAGLLFVALIGALPLASTADRGEPWFDYRAFAESLGPDDPVRFSWSQSYGPISWPRDGNEVMRITSGQPLYWKARDLDQFNGLAWQIREQPPDGRDTSQPAISDLAKDWEKQAAWTSTIAVSVKRMRTPDVVGAGTIVRVKDASRDVQPGIAPGTFDAPSGLRRNDSYLVDVHVPRPALTTLADATTGKGPLDGERVVSVPFAPGKSAPKFRGAFADPTPVRSAEVHFAPWDEKGGSTFAVYDAAVLNRSDFNVEKVMKESLYARTWALSKRLKKGAKHPMDYIRAVDTYLHGPSFRYTENPPTMPSGEAPLDYFINVSHQGYCQHYAGAMALLLRMGGIPARVATGFSPGGYSTRHKAWIVRDTDAHAWVEAWFDQYGWVTLDPTPAATPARSQIATLGSAVTNTPLTQDTGDSSTTGDNGPANPISVRPDLLLGNRDAANGGSGGEVAGVRWFAWAGGVLVVLALALAVVFFLRRPRGSTPMDRAIFEVEDAMRRVGRPVTTGTTLTQLERRLGSHSPEVAAYLRALASGRYALRPEPPPRSGRRALRRALAQGLGFGGGLRAWWALPPRPAVPARAPRSRVFELDTTVRG
jgi:protein-glutamine gamma-glutamyltransferase